MTLIELLLRLGCGLVAWMVIYAHCIWVAVIRVTDCSGDVGLWRLVFGFTPFTIAFSLLLGVTKKLKSVHPTIRLLGLPLIALVPLASLSVFPYLFSATLERQGICGTELVLWQIWWAPSQLAVLSLIVFTTYRAFIHKENTL